MTSLDVQTHHQLPPPAPRLPASSCPLHPDEHVTGFCASCLRERLTGLETTSSSTSSTSARKSTSSTFKSLFFKVTGGGGGGGGGAQPTYSSFLRPKLHRCKSFSCGCGDGLYGSRTSAAFEPQRKSYDIRIRNTLWSLFHQDDNERDKHGVRDPSLPSSFAVAAAAAAPAASGEIEAEGQNLGFPPPSSIIAPVLETHEEEEEERDNVDDIRVMDPVLVVGTSGEIEGGEPVEEVELKPMKDHIDLDTTSQAKKLAPKPMKNHIDLEAWWSLHDLNSGRWSLRKSNLNLEQNRGSKNKI